MGNLLCTGILVLPGSAAMVVRRLRPLAFTLALLAAFLAVPACRHSPEPGQPTQLGVLDCGVDAIAKCAPAAMPAVNTCLANMTDWQACLSDLVGPALCGAESVIACVVRNQGSIAGAEAALNKQDLVSARMAERARTWISTRGYRFADGGGAR